MRGQRLHGRIKPSMAARFPSLLAKQDLNHNIHMFTQDICLGIMPISGQTDEQQNFAVTLEGEDSECEKAKTIVAQLCEHNRRNSIAKMLCDSINKMARNLTWSGKKFYEIIEDDGKIYMHGFTKKNLFRIFSWYLQIVPVGDRNLWKRKYTLINKKKIWNIQIPHRLGGTREHRKIMRRLGKHRYMGPKFYEEDLAYRKITNNYDAIKYGESSDIYVRKVTKKWHWNKNNSSLEKYTRFYMFYKAIGLRWAQAILREHLISEINQLLGRLSVDCKIIVSGLPKADEILEIRNDMKSGKISFLEALNRTAVL